MINERERGGLLGTSSCFVTLRISRRKWPRKRYTHSRSCPPLLTQCKTDSHLTRFLFQMSAEEWKQALSELLNQYCTGQLTKDQYKSAQDKLLDKRLP